MIFSVPRPSILTRSDIAAGQDRIAGDVARLGKFGHAATDGGAGYLQVSRQLGQRSAAITLQRGEKFLIQIVHSTCPIRAIGFPFARFARFHQTQSERSIAT